MTEVQFANALVPVWKLRAGVVVSWLDTETGRDCSGHIEHFEKCSPKQTVICVNTCGYDRVIPSTYLQWLDPH